MGHPCAWKLCSCRWSLGLGKTWGRSAARVGGPQGVAYTWLHQCPARPASRPYWFLSTPRVDLLVRTESINRRRKPGLLINNEMCNYPVSSCLLSILFFAFKQNYLKKQATIRRLLGLRASGRNGVILMAAAVKLWWMVWTLRLHCRHIPATDHGHSQCPPTVLEGTAHSGPGWPLLCVSLVAWFPCSPS